MSHYFKGQFNVVGVDSADKDIPLATAVSVIDTHCIVERFRADMLSHHIATVTVEFRAASVIEAQSIVRDAAAAVQSSTDSLRTVPMPWRD